MIYKKTEVSFLRELICRVTAPRDEEPGQTADPGSPNEATDETQRRIRCCADRRKKQVPGRRLHRRPDRTVANSAIANLRHRRNPQGHSLPQSRVVRDGRGKGARGRQATNN